MTRKMIGFVLFILTGTALIVLSIMETSDPINIGLLLIIGAFFGVGLTDHYKDLKK
ncbi:hypothetical protein [Isachenkonia alkalipeptolytica]|uniref:hypothetical protein n=1 Tax=Isachenkonia alkalipeptolytica TaxID=2565777 RepID=UPI0013708D1F|nr:hypothetical protein [Isachenkonia alkalipeptolytica]